MGAPQTGFRQNGGSHEPRNPLISATSWDGWRRGRGEIVEVNSLRPFRAGGTPAWGEKHAADGRALLTTEHSGECAEHSFDERVHQRINGLSRETSKNVELETQGDDGGREISDVDMSLDRLIAESPWSQGPRFRQPRGGNADGSGKGRDRVGREPTPESQGEKEHYWDYRARGDDT